MVQLGRIGDFVLASGAIRLLLARASPLPGTLVVSDRAAAFARHLFPDVEQIVLPELAPGILRDVWPLRRRLGPRLAAAHYEARVCLQHQRSLYHETALGWIPADRDFRLLPATYPSAATADASLELLAHQRVAALVLRRPVELAEILPVLPAPPAPPGDALLVCPLSADPLRGLPPAALAAAVDQWRRRRNGPVRLCGAPSEAASLEKLAIAGAELILPRSPAEFIDAVRAAAVVVAGESSAAHLAAAADQRACVVLGGGSFGLCLPWRRSARQVFVYHPLPCYGCGWACTQSALHCLDGLSAAGIAAGLTQALEA